MNVRTLAVFASFLIGAAGCAGGGGAGSSALPSHVAPLSRGTATFTITVPAAPASAAAQRAARSPLYISSAATQLVIGLTQGGVNVSGYPQTVGLTPASPGCVAGAGGTVCTIVLNIPDGAYVASLTLEDSSGDALSVAQNIAINVATGVVNDIPVTLSGVPATLSIASSSPYVTGTQGAGFTLIGGGPHTFVINVRDADGKVIIGPGAPTFSVAQAGALALTVTPPATVASNLLTIAPPAAYGSTTTVVTLTATYPGATNACTQSGAQCSLQFSVGMQELVAAVYEGSNSVSLVEDGTTAVLATVVEPTGSAPDAIAFDTAGNLYIANYTGNIVEYAPPYSAATTTFSTNLVNPQALALDAAGNLYVANYNGAVVEFPAGSTTPSRTLTYASSAVANPVSICTDPGGDLFVDNDGGNGSIQEFQPGATTAVATISNALSALGIACDGLGNIAYRQYSGIASVFAVTVDGPLLTPVASLGSITGPQALTVDPHNNFYVANNETGPAVNIQKFPSGQYNPSFTINMTAAVNELAVDASGNIYAADDSGGFYEYPSGSTTRSASIANPVGSSLIQGLAISP